MKLYSISWQTESGFDIILYLDKTKAQARYEEIKLELENGQRNETIGVNYDVVNTLQINEVETTD